MSLRIKDNRCPHDWRIMSNKGPKNEVHMICMICKKRRTHRKG